MTTRLRTTYRPKALAVEALTWLARFGYARMYQLAGVTGATGTNLTRTMTTLRKEGLVDRTQVVARLRGEDGRIRSVTIDVWWCTTAGAKWVPQQEAAGSVFPAYLRGIKEPSPALVDHTLACVDVWVRAHRAGWDVVTERLIKATEANMERLWVRQSGEVRRTVPKPRYWTAPVVKDGLSAEQTAMLRGARIAHTPDGAIVRGGFELAVEIELATKAVADYRVTITSIARAGKSQVWFVESDLATKRVWQAAQKAGFRFTQPRAYASVAVSDDGMFRLTRYVRPQAVIGDLTRATVEQIDALFAGPGHLIGIKDQPRNLSLVWQQRYRTAA